MNKVLKNHLEEITILCQNYNVKSLYALGKVCSNDFNDYNEIDFLIDFRDVKKEQLIDRTFHMAFMLESVLQHKVELLSWEDAEYMKLSFENNPDKILLYLENNKH